MAGGGVKGGFAYGSTNAMGDNGETGIITTHDLHATVLTSWESTTNASPTAIPAATSASPMCMV
jgi:hypothetical protein